MKKITKLPIAVAISSALCLSHASQASDFFADSTVDLKWKVNYYDIEGEPDASIYSDLAEVDEMSIKDSGTSAWINWRSGWLWDTVGIELEPQGAFAFSQTGTVDGSASAYLSTGNIADIGTIVNTSVDNPYYYAEDKDQSGFGKIGNANVRFKVGSDQNQTQLMVGRFTPSIYDLLHRPDEIYYGMHQVYEGVNMEGHYEWSWGMMEPWARYMTGFSSESNMGTIDFKDLEDTTDYDSFNEIINVGFHTETDYYTSSASYSYAPDYLSNGIIEIYTGLPYSWIGLGDASGDKDHYIKFMIKYGMEEGLGTLNEDHSTDVYEFAIGLQHGDLDFLTGITQIGDESFTGFETQDGDSAGGGTAVWGDVAILNSFNKADQRVYFLVGGYNVTPHWRVQGVVAHATDTDLEALSTTDQAAIYEEDYTEVNLDFIYSDNGYQKDGMSYLLKFGKDDNYNAFGFGFFIEYNGDLMKVFGS